jgi:hypothetical protein
MCAVFGVAMCCTNYCTVAGGGCVMALCDELYEPGEAPEGLENLGICVSPS